MTCIVGLVDNGKVYLGGDSLGVAGLDATVRRDKKVFRNGEFIMGFTTSYRMGQLLQYKFTASRKLEATEDPMSYMVNVFVEDVRKCLETGGFNKKKDGQDEAGTFLVGFAGRLFRVDSDYQVGESEDGYDSCGCGQAYALGSFFTTLQHPPEQRIIAALETAEHFSAGVKSPFTTITL